MYELKNDVNDDITTAYANAVINNGEDERIQVLTLEKWEEEIRNNMGGGGFRTRKAYYTDEILPFDITITMKNEYGQGATFSIFGVELLNEGTGYSIDDITSEKACTFVARDLSPVKRIDPSNSVYRSSIDASRVNG